MASLGIRILSFLLAFCISLSLKGQSAFDLREGDLLFCCVDSANAITAVTDGVDGLPIDHVAVVHRIGGENGLLFVIEAVKPVVKLTAIDAFFRENPKILLARVNADLDVKTSVRRCLSMVGKPYDDLFLPGDSAVYCSELVQLCYVDHQRELVFDPVPMSFHDGTGQVTDYWTDFYAQRGMNVPEGAPGSNPGELSRRWQVTIIGKINFNGHDILFHRNR